MSVLITGAAGSIGSALAAEVSVRGPRRLVLLDSSEQGLFRLQREIAGAYVPVLGSICDGVLMRALATEHRFDLVFHAAAFKHLALLEAQPFAAIANNAVGTARLVEAMAGAGVPRVILLSTDKAVEPASILGASKRIAELVTLEAGYCVVRLGNVLGSEGSVLPILQRQIDRGEDVTITDRRATRYFLTLPHAARLLMLAAEENARHGLFVPEMGEPVSIDLLARELLAASAGSKSKIVATGLRPGEKLHEKLLASDESCAPAADSLLRRVHTPQPGSAALAHAMRALEDAMKERHLSQLLSAIRLLVPGYEPSSRWMEQIAISECMESKR